MAHSIAKQGYNQRLREQRLRARWSQRELADRLGTTINNVSRWELGRTTPGPYFRAKLCALFGQSAEELGFVVGNPTLPKEETREAEPSLSLSEEGFVRWTVPYGRNPHFTGREPLLEQIEQHLEPEGAPDSVIVRPGTVTRQLAIKGLGGVGKTQIAVEYTYRAQERSRYRYTLWVNAATSEAITASFVTLADVLPAVSAKKETNQHKLIEAIKRWLEQCQPRWLLIFDNADDVALVQPYLPQRGNGSILLTTRANATGSFAASLEIDKMGFIEGTHLLLRRAQRFEGASDDEINEAGNIVAALDYFPLAIDQAGAYIEETGCRFLEYLQMYQERRKMLLARRGTQASNYPYSVATTWSLSFQRVEQANPAAAELLRLCAFLAPDRIPEELLKQGALHWPPVLQSAAGDLFSFNQMLEALLTFSLVKRLKDDQMLAIHRLVQAVQVDLMAGEEQRQWAERIVRAMQASFPRDPKEEVATWPQCLRYLEQVQACDALIQQHALVFPDAANLLTRTAIYLCERASYTLAEPLFQRALALWEQMEEPEHPEVAEPLQGLAHLYRQQGRFDEATSLFQRALAIWEQVEGSENPRVASVLNNLALLSYDQGKFGEAEPLFQRALAIWEQHDHPKRAYALNGLANLYYQQGHFGEAEPLYQRALRIWKQQFGPEHPLVAAPLNNLAILYRKRGRVGEAEPLYQQALRIWEQQLGPEHAQVAYALVNLALLYTDLGKYQEAEPLYQRALRVLESQFGSDHPLVAHPLNGLADLYRAQCHYTEAELLYERALRIREQLESTHPDRAETILGLATLREAQGRYQEAVGWYQRALAIHEHIYGPEHPKTTETSEHLHATLRALGQGEVTAQFDGDDSRAGTR